MTWKLKDSPFYYYDGKRNQYVHKQHIQADSYLLPIMKALQDRKIRETLDSDTVSFKQPESSQKKRIAK